MKKITFGLVASVVVIGAAVAIERLLEPAAPGPAPTLPAATEPAPADALALTPAPEAAAPLPPAPPAGGFAFRPSAHPAAPIARTAQPPPARTAPLPAAAPSAPALTPGNYTATPIAAPETTAAPTRRFIIEPRPAPSLLGRAGTAAQPPAAAVAIELAEGVRVPIALAEPAADLTPKQAETVAAISDEFIDRIETAATTGPEEAIAETWDTQQEEADSQYRILFGDQAWNLKLMDAAIAAREGTTPAP